MEKEQYDEAREFARALNAKRQVMSDGALLDQCQQYLNALIEHLADNFEEHPQEELGAPKLEDQRLPPEPEPPRYEEPQLQHEVPRHLSHHKGGKAGKKHR